MADVRGVRRSGRRTVRPVEFWNFEKPDSESEKIVYNLVDLGKCSIYDTMSVKFLHGIDKSTKNKDSVNKVAVNKVNETKSSDGTSKTVKGKGKLPHANIDESLDNALGKTNEENKKKSFNNNKRETESVDDNRKIVKGKGKLLDFPRDASPDNSNKNTYEVNEKERFNNNVNESESGNDYRKVIKGKGKLPDFPRDASPDNSKENTREGNKKKRFSNGVIESKSLDDERKIVKGKGKLPDFPRDASPDNPKENTYEANEKERFSNNVNETESVDDNRKIIKGKGKLPDVPRDASPDNSKENTLEGNKKKMISNNVNEIKSVDGRRKIFKGKRKLLDVPSDTSPDNSKENTNRVNKREKFNNNLDEAKSFDGRRNVVKGNGNSADAPRNDSAVNSKENTDEMNKKERLTIKKHSASCTTFIAPEHRYKRKIIKERNVQDLSQRVQRKNDTVDQQQNFASFSYTVNSESVTSRYSGRIRTKPLEFWNFEKVEVKSLECGELSIVHHKQILPPPRNKKGKEKAAAATTSHPSVGPARTKSKHILQKQSSASSPSKRKLSSPVCSSIDKEVCIEDEKPSKQKRTSDEEQDSTVLSTACVTKFTDLNFLQCTEKNLTCYLARSFRDTKRDIHAGFVFLEQGKVVWKTTRETNLYVLEGKGTLFMVDNTAEGIALQLKDTFETIIPSGKKIAFIKDGNCKMLKLFIVLGSSPRR